MALRVIQVGVGGFGGTWLPRLAGSPDVELVGAVDTDPEVLARQAAAHNVPATASSVPEILEVVEADAAVVVTPPASHRLVADQAMEAGLHVLTEKPIADSPANAAAMVEHAAARGVTLMVSQNYRFSRVPRTVERLVREGTFGAVDSVMVKFFKGPKFEGSYRLTMPHPLVLDMCIHHFDLMRAILGRDAHRVYARSWLPSWSWFRHPPTLAAVFDFDGGVVSTYSGSWVTRGGGTTWRGDWRVELSGGVIEIRGEDLFVAVDGGEFEPYPADDMDRQGQDYSLKEFVTAIAEAREPECSGRDNLNSIDMVFKTLESVESGGPVEF